jgi:hypothetical protein
MATTWRFNPGNPCCVFVPPAPPVCGSKAFAFLSSCLSAGTPALGTVIHQDGTLEGAGAVQEIEFGGAIDGGTFQLNFNGETTDPISWSSTDATLVSNIQDAITALPGVLSGEITISEHDLTSGIGTVRADFAGNFGASPSPLITVWDNSLTGTDPTITTREVKPGYESRATIQGIYFGETVTGGTFQLEFDGETTSAISWSSTNATLQGNIDSALEALSNIGAGNVTVGAGSLVAGRGSATVTFIGPLAGTTIPKMTVADNSLTGTVRLAPIVGMTVTIERDAEVIFEGVTDDAGIVRVTFDENSDFYEMTLSGAITDDYYLNNPYELGLVCGPNTPIEGFGLDTRFIPVTWQGLDISYTVSIVGLTGDALGYSDTFEVPAFDEVTVDMPQVNYGDPLGSGENTYDYSTEPPLPDPFEENMPFRTLIQPGPTIGLCDGTVSVGDGDPHA